MPSGSLLLLSSLGYLGLLFGIAYYADWRRKQDTTFLASANVYAFSIAIYCTAWTFYGSVGLASQAGMLFLPIYLGPTLFMLVWPLVLRKTIRICKRYSLTSIADFLAMRYGNRALLGEVATLLAVIGLVPYIALQLKALNSLQQLLPDATIPVGLNGVGPLEDSAFYITLLLAAFTIIFGVRTLDSTEQHAGMMGAIAFESLVKLAAFFLVGVAVVYVAFSGWEDLFRQAREAQLESLWSLEGERTQDWFLLTLLSAMAILLLPRQFQVAVVENSDERHLERASWLFPLYLLLINLFVLPIALAGRLLFGEGQVDADTFVLALPLLLERPFLAWLAFIGGLSAATSMIVVEAVALATMVSNSLLLPLLMRSGLAASQVLSRHRQLLWFRRMTVLLLLLLSYAYFRSFLERYSLVSIGLISFTAVAQFAPAFFGGLYWKRGAYAGALTGLLVGFGVWFYALPLRQFLEIGSEPLTTTAGLAWYLWPYVWMDATPLGLVTQTMFWSLLLNGGCYVGVSLFVRQSLFEQGQAGRFVDALNPSDQRHATLWRGQVRVSELLQLLGHFMGEEKAEELLRDFTRAHGLASLENLGRQPELIEYVERQLAGSIGSVSARIVVASVVEEESLQLEDVMDLLDVTQQALAYSERMREQSQKLQQTTEELQQANARLTELDQLKDEFVSTITHELRTPLTSIRALAEILHDNPALPDEQRRDFLQVTISETERLTRLINQVLDFEKLESGRFEFAMQELNLVELLQNVLHTNRGLMEEKSIYVDRNFVRESLQIYGDCDAMTQVVLNLLSNAVKFCPDQGGRVHVSARIDGPDAEVRIQDNGIGIQEADRHKIFERFYQVSNPTRPSSAGTGLGLAISRNILIAHNGTIGVAPGSENGAIFYFRVPLRKQSATTNFERGGSQDG